MGHTFTDFKFTNVSPDDTATIAKINLALSNYGDSALN
jgi:hypothetical protein